MHGGAPPRPPRTAAESDGLLRELVNDGSADDGGADAAPVACPIGGSTTCSGGHSRTIGELVDLRNPCSETRQSQPSKLGLRLVPKAVRERHTHLAYLAEILAAETDDRASRRRARRIGEARFPRLKRLAG
jgi:hypothetical protein